jgi:hypothetical protein
MISRFAGVLVRSGRKSDRGRIFHFERECAHQLEREIPEIVSPRFGFDALVKNPGILRDGTLT